MSVGEAGGAGESEGEADWRAGRSDPDAAGAPAWPLTRVTPTKPGEAGTAGARPTSSVAARMTAAWPPKAIVAAIPLMRASSEARET